MCGIEASKALLDSVVRDYMMYPPLFHYCRIRRVR